jgi:two-component sensor histidine kinase
VLSSGQSAACIDADDVAFLAGGGELGALIRDFDWSRTSLGAISAWPQSLKSVAGMLLLSPVPIVLLWGEDGVMIYNDAYSVFAGGRHPYLLGRWAEIADFNDNVMKVGLAGRTLAYKDQELTLHRHGRPEPVWMNLDYSPVLDESGRPAGVIAIVVETTERVLAERRVAESEVRFRALVNATSDVVYRMSADWTEMRALDGRGFLSDTESPSVAWVDEYLLPEDVPHIHAAIAEAVRFKRVFQLEHRVRRIDGSTGWTFSRAVPVLNDRDEIVEWFGAASDVTERHTADQHLRLVINELNHRVKNNLAMTQAIAAQTFRNADDLAQAQAKFSARIMALAQANDLLTGERWVGASLRGVLNRSVRPHCAEEPDRCRIAGPELRLSPKTALSLSMAMHELATNALKYGAWSTGEGQVSINWDRYAPRDGPERIRLEWRERGGPPVAPPQKRGFGSRLVERGLAAELGGEVTMEFQPEGLVCLVDVPLTLYGEG